MEACEDSGLLIGVTYLTRETLEKKSVGYQVTAMDKGTT